MTETIHKKSQYPILWLVWVIITLVITFAVFFENGKLMSLNISWAAFISCWIMYIPLILSTIWYVYFFHEDEHDDEEEEVQQ